MAKKPLTYKDQVSFLAVDGTLQTLVSVAFYLGHKGRLGEAARYLLSLGINQFLTGLSQQERKRYNEISESVKIAASMKNNP